MIKFILATGLNGELGKGDKLPWNVPEDLAYFKKQTHNGIVVMGSKTFYSLPFINGLPDRDNIVLSRSEGHNREGVEFIDTIDWVLGHDEIFPKDTMWIIGGASVYELFKPYVTEVHHTQITRTFVDSDVYFDTKWFTDNKGWCKVSSETLSEKAVVSVYKKEK